MTEDQRREAEVALLKNWQEGNNLLKTLKEVFEGIIENTIINGHFGKRHLYCKFDEEFVTRVFKCVKDYRELISNYDRLK